MRRLPLLFVSVAALSSPLVACSKADDNSKPAAPTPATAVPGTGSGTSTPGTSPTGTTPTGTSPASPGKVGRGITAVSTLLAGDGTDSGKGVPGAALSVSLRASEDIASAPNGDVYVVDRFGNRLLLVHAGQVTIAFNGDAVKENGFSGIAIDAQGKIVFGTDQGINQLNPDGTAALLVDRRATAIGTGFSLAFGPDGFLYVASDAHRVYKIDGSTPTPIAGDGTTASNTTSPGDGGPALKASFSHIADIVVDKAGVVYIADDVSNRVRAVGADGTIKTVAGGGTTPLGGTSVLAPEGTPVTSLTLTGTTSVAVDAKGILYVTDAGTHTIFRLDSTGGLQVVIGDVGGVIAQSGKPANETRVLSPGDLAMHEGTLFYIDRQDLHSIVGLM